MFKKKLLYQAADPKCLLVAHPVGPRAFHRPAERHSLSLYFVKLKADICILQETHLLQPELGHLKTQQFSQTFSATYNSRQRGVSISINKNIPFTHHSTAINPEGHYVINNASIHDKKKKKSQLQTYTALTMIMHHSLTHSSPHYRTPQIS